MLLSSSEGIFCLFIICSLMIRLAESQGAIKCSLKIGGTSQAECEAEEGDTVYLNVDPDSGTEKSLIYTRGGVFGQPNPNLYTAEAGRDYSHIATQINADWTVIPLDIADDCEIESKEVLYAFITPEDASNHDAFVEITIDDDDDEYYLENEYYEVNEDDGSITFYVCRRSEGALAESEISYSTCDMSAVSGESGDFTSSTGTIDFTADSSACVSEEIAINEDEVEEGDEVFGINIAYDDPVTAGCIGRVIEPSKAVVTIHDVAPDTGPEPEAVEFYFEFCDYAVTEPASGSSQILIKVIRSGNNTAEETVEVNTRGVSGSSNSDFDKLETHTVTLDAGSSETEFGITINADTTAEDPETFEVSLSNPSDGSVGDASKAIVTIYDVSRTGCCISFESSIYTVKESGTATICLRREGNPEKSGGIGVSTEDIDASSGADYTAVSTTLPFDSGDTYKCFDVVTLDDRLKEDTEVLKVSLVELSTEDAIPTCSKETAQVMIKDDDDEFYLEGKTYKVKESAKEVEIVIVRSGYLGRVSSICVSTISGDALPTRDYNGISNQEIAFSVNQRSHPLKITINEDNVPENEEEFVVVLETCSSNTDVSADQIGFPRKATVCIQNTFTCDTPCGNNGDCVAENTCGCSEGYTGAVCDTPVCDPTCVNGECVGVNSCQCITGWIGDVCSTPVCNPQCVNGECVDVDTCECFSGWGGDSCDILSTRISMSLTVEEFPVDIPLLWTNDLADPDSERFKELKADIEVANDALYRGIITGYVESHVTSFEMGSVIVNEEIVVETSSNVGPEEVTRSIMEAIDNNGVLGNLVLNAEDPLVVATEQPAVQCPFSYCLNGGNCIETETSYYCFCQTGYTGSRCESVIQQPPSDDGDGDGDSVETGGLSDGVLVGIILGVLVAVLIVLCLGIWWWWVYFGRPRSLMAKGQGAIQQQQQGQVLVNIRPYNGRNLPYELNEGIMGMPPLY